MPVAVAVAAAGVAAGCGDGDYENALRPPPPITVTAAIDDERVRVSPRTFGAGPVTFVISNQSGAAQQVTFETDEIGGGTGGIRRSTDRIGPRSTAELKADPREGTYRLAVGARSIEPARIEVSKERRSAQDDLLQP
jgi:hypothetical protein